MGSKNKKTLALEEAARKAVEKIDDAFDGDPHAFQQAEDWHNCSKLMQGTVSDCTLRCRRVSSPHR